MFRLVVCLLLAAALLPAQSHRLFATAVRTDFGPGGPENQPFGLFLRGDAGEWTAKGFETQAIVGVDHDREDPRRLLLAAGNGCFEATDEGDAWRLLTGWRVTELQDVSVDPNRKGRIYLALPDGIGFSPDGGRTWTRRTPVTPRKYFHNVVVDRTQAGRVIAGGEAGLFVSRNEGGQWMFVGGAGAQITNVVQSGADPRRWAATSQFGGLLLSRDGGLRWRSTPSLDASQTLYSADFDPRDADRIAVGGWGVGAAISEDGGATWRSLNRGLPSKRIWRVAFDPDHPGRIYAAVHEKGLYVSQDGGRSWRLDGLPNSVVRELRFVPEPK